MGCGGWPHKAHKWVLAVDNRKRPIRRCVMCGAYYHLADERPKPKANN